MGSQPDDILALYTDGVTEQENEAGEEFSVDRLNELIVRKETEPGIGLVADISETVFTFAGTKEQADDLTVVVVKVS
ncbi:MAG: SpoIIE family protein phosphatase [Silvibacterium sp.]|jgi:sigma-B regulation protein RsbU (phosphoserine phosphatase)